MKHDTYMTCSIFKTISNTSPRHKYAHFNHHYSPWTTFWAVFPTKPMLLNYCRIEIFLTHLFSRKTGDSYFWSSFISVTVFRGIVCGSMTMPISPGDSCFWRQVCAFRFTWFVYRVLEIGDGGDTHNSVPTEPSGELCPSLQATVSPSARRGSETGGGLRFIDSPLILGYKHKYMQIQTHWHEHSFHFGCCFCENKKTLSAADRKTLPVHCWKHILSFISDQMYVCARVCVCAFVFLFWYMHCQGLLSWYKHSGVWTSLLRTLCVIISRSSSFTQGSCVFVQTVN